MTAENGCASLNQPIEAPQRTWVGSGVFGYIPDLD